MLKQDVIKANPLLATLTDDQIKAIETMSENDENTVISNKTGEIYGNIDKDVLEVSGMAKVGTEKTYDYVKRVAKELKEKAEGSTTLTAQIETLKTEKTRLEKALADNAGDKELSKKLDSVTAELETTKVEYGKIKTQLDTQATEYDTKLKGYRIENEIRQGLQGMKFKKEFPEAVVTQLTSNVVKALKENYNHDFIDDGNGGQRMVFLDKTTGARINNPATNLMPYTAPEFLEKELTTLGILDKGRQQGGGGAEPPGGGGGTGGTLDLSSAKSKVEATNLAAQALAQQGLAKGTAKYQEALDKAWADYKISKLPEN